VPISPVGAVPDVVAGADILDEWGNATGASSVGRVVHRFASPAQRDAAIPNPVRGMLAVTTDTDTLWQARGAAPAWVELYHPGVTTRVYGLQTQVSTDAFGNFGVNLPAGSKAVSGSGISAMVSYPMILTLNAQDQPMGGAGVVFIAKNDAGGAFASTVITVSVLVVYQ